jgi:ribonuclease HI
MKKVTIWFDGSCNPNPGRMAIGVVLEDASGTVKEVSEALEADGTSNQAEYHAVIRGLKEAKALGATGVVVKGDSNLVVQQVTGRFRVQKPELRPLHKKVVELAEGFDEVDVQWVPREQNAHADALSKKPLGVGGATKGGSKLGSKPSKREHSVLCPRCRKPCTLSIQVFKDGSEHIRQECPEHGFVGYAPDEEPFRSLARRGG